MNYFLAKTDPETYSIDDLEREGKTVWNGIKNPQALKAIKAMRPKDYVFVYHSMGDSGIVGLMKVMSEPRVDGKNPKSWVVDVEFVCKYGEPIMLREVKTSHQFDDWTLVYHSRLSTMAVPEKFVKWVEKKGYKVR